MGYHKQNSTFVDKRTSMKPLVILILSFSFSLTAFGQIEYPDSGFTNKAEAKNITVNGLKEGKWVEYKFIDSTNTIKPTKDSNAPYYELTVYKDDTPIGIVKGYYKSGKLATLKQYFKGKRNGIDKAYYENGKLGSAFPYSNDTLNGLAKVYLQSGELEYECTYISGKEAGIAKEYYQNGDLSSENPYTNGKKNGIVKDYYHGKILKRETPYMNDRKNGVVKEYYESGKLKCEVSYTDSNRNGVAKWYFESGGLMTEILYSDGKVVSTKNYDKNGNEVNLLPEPPDVPLPSH
jgi:antitoxin component YwqK of YwqJK toxin-antitoxin module